MADSLIADVKIQKTFTEGTIEAISDVKAYKCCRRPQCYHKKLTDKNQCPTCTTKYEDDIAYGYVCKVVIKNNEDYIDATLFKQHIQELVTVENNADASVTELKLLSALPIKIKYT